MDQEHEDYADRDLPPALKPPSPVLIVYVIPIIVCVAVVLVFVLIPAILRK